MNVRVIFAAVSGFVGGLALGAVLGDKTASNRANAIIDREIDAARLEFKDRYSKREVEVADPVQPLADDPVSKPTDNISEEKAIELEAAGHIISRYDGENIFVITKDEFDNDAEWHEKIELVYYTEDDVLVDETTGQIHEDDDAVGRALEFFGYDEQNMSYIRNTRLEMDFAIERVEDYYSRVVLSVPVRKTRNDEDYD